MKCTKIIFAILAILIIASTLTGCCSTFIASTIKDNLRKPYKFSLEQDISEVAKVEILQKDDQTLCTRHVVTLDQETATALLKDICNLDVMDRGGYDFDHAYYGTIVYVTYKNGEAEGINSNITKTYDSEGRWQNKYCKFSSYDLDSVILKHTKNYLPDDVVLYLEEWTN